MVLLTSSTVSAIISMGVIVIFTLLLFLSGYILQQQSVRSIQDAIRPQDPNYPISHSRHGPGSSYRNVARDLDDNQSYSQDEVEEEKGGEGGQQAGNYAYLQLLSNPDPAHICSAILFFQTLATNGTAVQDRLFMYPQEWDHIALAQNPTDQRAPASATKAALRHLRTASKKYSIWPLPIDMSPATRSGYPPTDTKLLRLGQIQFMAYDSVLYLQTPGLLLDTAKVDDILLSKRLPGRYDKARRESFDNEAWVSMPLKAEREDNLPSVYLVTVNSVETGHVEARGHVMNEGVDGFGALVGGPRDVLSKREGRDDGDGMLPGYVIFEDDQDGRVRWDGNPAYGTWRKGLEGVCPGVDFDDITSDEEL